jgi:toxin ParE1/3/4
MKRVVWLRRASRDLDAILGYIAQDNPAAAKQLVSAIREQVDLLASHSNLGRAGRVMGTRELVVHKNCLLCYRVREERVETLCLQRAKRRWPKEIMG